MTLHLTNAGSHIFDAECHIHEFIGLGWRTHTRHARALIYDYYINDALELMLYICHAYTACLRHLCRRRRLYFDGIS